MKTAMIVTLLDGSAQETTAPLTQCADAASPIAMFYTKHPSLLAVTAVRRGEQAGLVVRPGVGDFQAVSGQSPPAVSLGLPAIITMILPSHIRMYTVV